MVSAQKNTSENAPGLGLLLADRWRRDRSRRRSERLAYETTHRSKLDTGVQAEVAARLVSPTGDSRLAS